MSVDDEANRHEANRAYAKTLTDAEIVDLAEAVLIDNEHENDWRGNHATLLARAILHRLRKSPE